MLKRLHVLTATTALLTILACWLTSAIVVVAGTPDQITSVKQVMPWGFLLLAPALATAGATGAVMAGASPGPIARAKQRRTLFVALLSLLALAPAAFVLRSLASADDFGAVFIATQAVELAAGAAGLTLLALNIRAGRQLSAGPDRPNAPSSSVATLDLGIRGLRDR